MIYRRKKQNKASWYQTYKPDDVVYTMLFAVANIHDSWPDELDDPDNAVYIQLINNESRCIIKHETSADGKRHARNISKYICIRMKNVCDELVDICTNHANIIDYTHHKNKEVTFRYEITNDLLEVLEGK